MNHHIYDQYQTEALIREILTSDQQKSLQTGYELDFALTLFKEARFRVNVYYQDRGIAAAFRMIPMNIPSLNAIGLEPILKKLLNQSEGFILITGPTGSGKTTTLAAMVDYVNTHYQHHIITIEDPIEYIHTCKKSLIHQREVQRHSKSFHHALRAVLREDPDIILIGELRDLETIRLALTAAETGHLVFATLHTASAAKTIHRIIDVFPGSEKAMIRSLLSNTLTAVISQVLVKNKTGNRMAVHEIMVCNPAIRNLIREDKIQHINSVMQTGQTQGMQTFDQHLKKIAQANIIIADQLYE